VIPDALADPAWNAERERLQEEVRRAVMALLDHTGAAGFEWDYDGEVKAMRYPRKKS